MKSAMLPARPFALTLVGVLLLQAAWILAVVPFRGADEHEHAFKAAAVAHGDFARHHEPSPTGWGEYVEVPEELAVAAAPVCAKRPRNGPDCLRRDAERSGFTQVQSSAARYNPAYYAVVGTVARPFSGLTALYVMRTVTAVFCAVLAAIAVTVLLGAARTRAPAIACLIVLAPVFTYATAIVAPNGPEMAAALLLWCCLLRLGLDDPEPGGTVPPHARGLVALSAFAAVVLVTLRTLGPLWCAIIVVVCALVARPGRVRSLLRSAATRWSIVVVAAATAAALGWTLTASTNSLGADPKLPGSAWDYAGQLATRWLRQSVGTFPSRNEFAPPIMYLLFGATALVVFVGFLRLTHRRLLIVWVLLVLVIAAIPITFTVLTWRDAGEVWQGRYGYPILIGLALLGALAWEHAARPLEPHDRTATAGAASASVRPSPAAVYAVAVVMTTVHGFALAGASRRQRLSEPTFDDLDLSAPPRFLLVVLAVFGVAVLIRAALPRPTDTPTDTHSPK